MGNKSIRFLAFSNTPRLILCIFLFTVNASCSMRPTLTNTPAPRSSPTLLPMRTIISSDLPLHEIWRETTEMRLGSGSVDTPSSRALLATQEAIYSVNYHPTDDDPLTPWQVIALDVKTGTQLWATEQFGHVHSLAMSQKALFVATSLGIRAYDITSGKQKWISNQPPPDHEAYSIFYDEPQLYLVIRRGSQFLFSTIDPESGHVGEVWESDDIIVKIDSQFRYVYDGEKFWVEDLTTNRMRWEIPIFRSPIWPTKSDSLLVLPAVRGNTGWHSVMVLDLDDGQKLWECLDCYASDVAVDRDALYTVMRDGSLAAYDTTTGQLIGRVQFAGGGEMDPLNTQYSVAALNGYVFSYFGDSQELIAFGP